MNGLHYIYTRVTETEQIQSSVLRSVSGFTFKISLRESERNRQRYTDDFNTNIRSWTRTTQVSLSQEDESAWISEHFTALHSISDCGGLWWQTDGQTWWVNQGCWGGWGYLKADFSSLKAACLCFLSSASRFFSSCSWRISASNRFDSLMACTCQRQICIFR